MANPRSRTRPAHTAGVTLQQVARQAGVSLATASRVLHGSGARTVGEELRRRVEAAAEELRYVSNAPAQALARATSNVVGLIVHDVADPYFGAIAAGAMRAAREQRLMVMIAATFREPGLELEYLRSLRAQRARAVILAGSGTTDTEATERLAEEIAGFEADGGRVVCIGDRGPDLDTVAMANRSGGGQAVRGLWELGHRRIGVVAGPSELLTVRHRLDGARRALRGLGAPAAPDAVETGDFTREGGRAAAVRLLRARPDLTAVLVLNDVMAAGALAGLRDDLGLAVPDRVSVVGFDDVPFAADLRPALTTVRLPLEAAGEEAVRLLLDPSGDEPRRVDLPAELVLRGSTAPAAG
ncbi:LacI family transcriptional regulator [Streptacidiphilus pinicola]|uniref:LacI family transcriptional regulator n=1 Tax=Streptacidiphilus pinicola TaxID=2219663 RepID=A0A2X0IF45_9ACTN|nr:LacI family DNA-binding transcriptional regulator [Streptacidiphilus pinicola]RAG83137.1 LacI family transcriptional regulator [Streptacidiphilus pinicola]